MLFFELSKVLSPLVGVVLMIRSDAKLTAPLGRRRRRPTTGACSSSPTSNLLSPPSRPRSKPSSLLSGRFHPFPPLQFRLSLRKLNPPSPPPQVSRPDAPLAHRDPPDPGLPGPPVAARVVADAQDARRPAATPGRVAPPDERAQVGRVGGRRGGARGRREAQADRDRVGGQGEVFGIQAGGDEKVGYGRGGGSATGYDLRWGCPAGG